MRSAAATLNFLDHTARAESISLSLSASRAGAISAGETPFSMSACRMRADPKRLRLTCTSCSTARASESQPRSTKSSSNALSSCGSSSTWGASLRSSSSRVCSRRASSRNARARSPGWALRFFCDRRCSTVDAEDSAYFRLDLLGDLGMFLQILARVVLALADTLLTVGVPRAGFLYDAMEHAELDDLAFTRDAFAVQNVEFGVAERRGDLVLDHFRPRFG